MGAYRGLSVNITGQGEPQTLDGASVTGELFSILVRNLPSAAPSLRKTTAIPPLAP